MRRGTVIVIIFVLVAGAIIGASQFLRSQPPVELNVAVSPLIANWAQDAVTRYNATQPIIGTQRIQFNVSVVEDLSVWQGSQNWTAQNHPAAWIPASSASVNYSSAYRVVTPSLAQTLLVWGGYQSRVEVATDGAVLDWETVQALAEDESWAAAGGQSSWGFVQLGFPRPDQTMTGLAVLFTAAGDFNDNTDLSGDATRSTAFRNWLTPVVNSVNYQTLGADAAAAMARGPSTIQIALLPESQWLLNLGGLTDSEPVIFAYPSYQFVFDFPLASWSNTNEIATTERDAVTALGTWLSQAAQQNLLPQQGLRPASGEIEADAALFTQGEPLGIQLQPDLTNIVQVPGRNEAQGLVQWVSQRR